jgi:hypothetical protein
MYCVLWTYAVPPAFAEEAIRRQFAAVADRYLGVPGLIRKYFGFTEDGKSVIGIYLRTSREAADAFCHGRRRRPHYQPSSMARARLASRVYWTHDRATPGVIATGLPERSPSGRWLVYGLLALVFVLLGIRLFGNLGRTA